MAIITKSNVQSKRVIDLDSPNGNAYYLIGTAVVWARQMGYETQEVKELEQDMMSSDYEHLIQVFDKHFGDICDLHRSGPEGGYDPERTTTLKIHREAQSRLEK